MEGKGSVHSLFSNRNSEPKKPRVLESKTSVGVVPVRPEIALIRHRELVHTNVQRKPLHLRYFKGCFPVQTGQQTEGQAPFPPMNRIECSFMTSVDFGLYFEDVSLEK
jgi:hypothetical protein